MGKEFMNKRRLDGITACEEILSIVNETDMRVGQLFECLSAMNNNDLFNIENDDLIELIKQYTNQNVYIKPKLAHTGMRYPEGLQYSHVRSSRE